MSIFNEHQHNCPLQNPTLAIGSNDLTAQNTATFLYKIDGEIYGPKSVANLAALTGITIETGYKAVISFYVDAAGNTRAEKGEEVPVAGTLSFKNEEIPLYYDGDEALIGFIIVANATGSQFVGGTTQLDAVGVTTTYINNFGWVGM